MSLSCLCGSHEHNPLVLFITCMIVTFLLLWKPKVQNQTPPLIGFRYLRRLRPCPPGEIVEIKRRTLTDNYMAVARTRLVVSDFIMSFLWAWSGALIKMFVNRVLGLGHEPSGEVIKVVLSIVFMFFFAFLAKVSQGGAHNPLAILSVAVSGDFSRFLFTVGARIPAQVIGSITGVKLIIQTFPEIGRGPRLNVDIHRGALTEALLAYAVVTISLGLARKMPGSFFMKTWMSSISKFALHVLGSDLTGGCMNPASAMGWAFARGDHITKEHILVYWFAPIEAALLAVWTFKLVVQPLTEGTKDLKAKSE